MVGHKDSVTCFAQDGNFLISGSDDMSVIIWNTVEWYVNEANSKINTITPHKVLNGHTQSIQDLCVLPNNGIVLSCSYDQKVIAWTYHKDEENALFREYNKKEQLRCMDFVDYPGDFDSSEESFDEDDTSR